MTASRIHPVFDRSGLRQKLIEVSKVRHLPEHLIYFATCVGIGNSSVCKHAMVEVTNSLDLYGYKDLRGIDRIHTGKGMKSPITMGIHTAAVKCKYAGFVELGDVCYLKLNFVQDGGFPSNGVIQERQIFSRSQSIITEDIAGLRGGIDSDSDLKKTYEKENRD